VRPRRGRTNRHAWFAAAALLVAVFLVFGQVGGYGFVDYDDDEYVFGNPHLRDGSLPERVRWAFTSLHASNWHPLTWLSFIADDALFGLDPGRMHAENLALHGLNVLLLLLLLVRLTGAPGKSALVAALFAVHPLRAESVAWVTERKGLLMALFSLGALHAHLWRARRPGRGRSAVVAALTAGALLAKPQAVALPALLLVFDWWPLGRIGSGASPAARRRAVLEKLPLLAMACAVTALTVVAQREGGAVAPLSALGVGERLARAVSAPLLYVGKTLWPAALSPAYPLAREPAWLVVAAVTFAVATTLAALRWRRRRPWLAAGWLGFLVLLAPVSNLFQAGGQALADRYTYLPHLPLLVLVVWAGANALERRPRLRVVGAAAVLVGVVALGVAAHRQTAVWRDDVSLFSQAVAATTGNWKMHYNLGNALAHSGRLEEAERQYLLALQARPRYAEALNNLGALYGERGDAAAAERLFLRALTVDPGYAPAWSNLGLQRQSAGDSAGALRAYARAAALQPGRAQPRLGMGVALLALGRRREALAACGEALRIAPESADAAACVRQAAAPAGP
jgi:tetratricopeptide (TPR) repeat protein